MSKTFLSRLSLSSFGFRAFFSNFIPSLSCALVFSRAPSSEILSRSPSLSLVHASCSSFRRVSPFPLACDPPVSPPLSCERRDLLTHRNSVRDFEIRGVGMHLSLYVCGPFGRLNKGERTTTTLFFSLSRGGGVLRKSAPCVAISRKSGDVLRALSLSLSRPKVSMFSTESLCCFVTLNHYMLP